MVLSLLPAKVTAALKVQQVVLPVLQLLAGPMAVLKLQQVVLAVHQLQAAPTTVVAVMPAAQVRPSYHDLLNVAAAQKADVYIIVDRQQG